MSGLTLRGFSVRAGRKTLLRIDRLNLPATGLIGVIGPNGAGKSTLLHALAGILPYDGQKLLDGGWPAPARIGFLPQGFVVTAALTVAECVLLGRRERLGWRITPEDRAEVARALGLLGLLHLADRRMDRLSGGQQQLVLLAQRISRDPGLLILDEPTSALDLHHQLEVLGHLKTLSRGILVIVALHDLTLAGRFADALVLIDRGRLVAVGPPVGLFRPDVLDPTYAIASECLRDRAGHPVVVAHGRPAS